MHPATSIERQIGHDIDQRVGPSFITPKEVEIESVGSKNNVASRLVQKDFGPVVQCLYLPVNQYVGAQRVIALP